MNMYDAMGGSVFVEKLLKAFRYAVMQDPVTMDFFLRGERHHALENQLKVFLTVVLEGPNFYTAQDITHAHRHLVHQGLSDQVFDNTLQCLETALIELAIPEETRDQILSYGNSFRLEVLGRF